MIMAFSRFLHLYVFYYSNTGSSFIFADSNSVLSPYESLPIAQENKYLGVFRDIFLFNLDNVYCVYSLESP